MLNVAFIYSYEKAKWEKCTDPKYFEKDIEDTPCVTLVEYTGYNFRRHLNTDYVFCPKHNAMEYILDISDNRVVSDEGCCLEGLLGFAKIHGGYMGCFDNKPVFAPFRWRVFQGASFQAVNIACDVMRVKDDVNGILTKWLSYSLSVNFVSGKLVISRIKQDDNTYASWLATDVDIPEVVVETAIEALRENTFCATGIKPSVLCQIKNKTTLMAYLERPFDLNIVLLKNFFREFINNDGIDIFDEIFASEEKDNYKIICNLLEIKPPKSLRKAYAFNPYAIVWYMILTQWGIKDINYIQKFFYLDDCIANMYLHKFYYDKEEKRVTRDAESLRDWNALEFYCHWLLEHKGEKKMIKWLYHHSAKVDLTKAQRDTIASFYEYYDQLTEETKARLLKDGLTAYIHDAISEEITALAANWESTKLRYNKVVQSYACKINEYEFRLLPNTKMLSRLGAAFYNCVASYRYDIEKYESIIVYVMNDTDYVACIEIKKRRHIVQASGKHNRRLTDAVNEVCYFWAKHNNLVLDVDDIHPVSKEELAKFDDVVVEPIPYVKALDEMELDEFRNIEANKIYKGYYLRLEQLLSTSNKYPLSAPPWMEFTDEASRLTYLLPEGERIFKEAGRGNTEAMLALGLMYFKGRVIIQDYDKSLEWLNKAAELGNSEAANMINKVKNYMNKKLSKRDLAILSGLSAMRHRVAVGEIG